MGTTGIFCCVIIVAFNFTFAFMGRMKGIQLTIIIFVIVSFDKFSVQFRAGNIRGQSKSFSRYFDKVRMGLLSPIGADPRFFLGGGALLRNDVTDGEAKKKT